MYGTIDTVLVQEKQLDKAKDANAGTRVSTIDIEILNSNRTKSLAELLSENSVVYIKSLGQGALATSSFRGTVLLTLVSTGMVSTSILPWQVPSTSHKFQSSSPTTWNYNMVLET